MSRYSLITTRAGGSWRRHQLGRGGAQQGAQHGVEAFQRSSRLRGGRGSRIGRLASGSRRPQDRLEQRHVRRAARGLPRRPAALGPAPMRWRMNCCATVSAVSPVCSDWNSACTAATRAPVRGRPGRLGPHGHPAIPQPRASAICASMACAASAALVMLVVARPRQRLVQRVHGQQAEADRPRADSAPKRASRRGRWHRR